MDRYYAKRLLRLNEGDKRHGYYCTAGYLTIGVGRRIDKEGPGLRETERDFMLDNDIIELEIALTDRVEGFAVLDVVRKTVLVDMAHNMGVAGLLRFKRMLSELRVGDYEAAGAALMASEYGRKLPVRAERNRDMLVSGDWPREILDD